MDACNNCNNTMYKMTSDSLIDYNSRDLGITRFLDLDLIECLFTRHFLNIGGNGNSIVSLSDLYITPYIMNQICLFITGCNLVVSAKNISKRLTSYLLASLSAEYGLDSSDSSDEASVVDVLLKKDPVNVIRALIKFLQDNPEASLKDQPTYNVNYLKVTRSTAPNPIQYHIYKVVPRGVGIENSYIQEISRDISHTEETAPSLLKVTNSYLSVREEGTNDIDISVWYNLDSSNSAVMVDLQNIHYLHCVALLHKFCMLYHLAGMDVHTFSHDHFFSIPTGITPTSLAEEPTPQAPIKALEVSISKGEIPTIRKISLITDLQGSGLTLSDFHRNYTGKLCLNKAKLNIQSSILTAMFDSKCMPSNLEQSFDMPMHFYYFVSREQEGDKITVVHKSGNELVNYRYLIDKDDTALKWLTNNKNAILINE